jgi:hypothetical protein
MVVNGPDDALPELRRLPTVTLDGWRRYVDTKPSELTLLDRDVYDGLDDIKRDLYDEQRIGYHSELVTVQTSTVRKILHQGRLMMMVNQREISARRSLIVNGPWASGKTTTIKLLGKVHEQKVRMRYPGQDRIPVVYITTPPKGSPRRLASEFAHFLGIPNKARYNVSDITDAVCHVLTDAKTDLVIVDEIHNLNLATSAGEDMSDHLKYFTEHMPATFVYAGINVERTLFAGLRGKQISARSVMVNTGPFPFGDEWRSLVVSLETALRLYDHKPGTLIRNAKYLHQRSDGKISSLSFLVRTAAISAILSGQEAVTRKLLDETACDNASDFERPRPDDEGREDAG